METSQIVFLAYYMCLNLSGRTNCQFPRIQRASAYWNCPFGWMQVIWNDLKQMTSDVQRRISILSILEKPDENQILESSVLDFLIHLVRTQMVMFLCGLYLYSLLELVMHLCYSRVDLLLVSQLSLKNTFFSIDTLFWIATTYSGHDDVKLWNLLRCVGKSNTHFRHFCPFYE